MIKQMFLLALIIAIGMVVIFSCMEENVVVDDTIYTGQLVPMIVLEDVTIKTYSMWERGPVGTTISKGTRIVVNCYDLVCQFPDTFMYVEREFLAPAPPTRIEGDRSG